MNNMPNYLCPLCTKPLNKRDQQLVCCNNHSFDFAKEGYINLLPVQFKRSKEPGDNKDMVNARRQFLEKSYYQPLCDKILALQQRFAPMTKTILDAGCGEGYYTNQHKTDNNEVYGIDIAKEAVKKAAKKYHACHFSVGTLSKLPFISDYIDWIYSVYAPIIEQEFTRVLAKGGYLLTVTPAAQHLIQLKQYIYQSAQEHDQTKVPIVNLTLIHEEQLTYQMLLDTGEDVINLLSMTPFAFKASDDIKRQLQQLDKFQCQADFLIRIYQ